LARLAEAEVRKMPCFNVCNGRIPAVAANVADPLG